MVGPSIAACIMLVQSKNQNLWSDFYSRLRFDSMKISFILGILFFMPSLIACAIIISCFFGLSLDQFTVSGKSPDQALNGLNFLDILFVLFLSCSGEEIGWRGYGIDSLRSKYNLWQASFLQSFSFIDSGFVPDLPYQGKHMYVFTRQLMQTNRTDVTFVSSIEEYLNLINQGDTIKRVWLLGGAELIASFKAYDLIDECIVTIIPTYLGQGIAFPKNVSDDMQFVASRNFFDDIVELTYLRKQ